MIAIAVLITCHNRKSSTLRCISNLYEQYEINKTFTIEVYLVDDNSIDGTSDEIKKQFPRVNIIFGDGNLYWNRGMHLAWKTAASINDYDFYLWLNDDTFLFKDAIVSCLRFNINDVVFVGATLSEKSKILTYGGFSEDMKSLIKPNGQLQMCSLINGNFVLIPKQIFVLLGNLDPIFHHALGDYDYFFRGRKKNVNFFLASQPIGLCENHVTANPYHIPSWRNNSISVLKRLSFLYQPPGGVNPFHFFLYSNRHFGLLKAISTFLSLHIRCIFPSFWKG